MAVSKAMIDFLDSVQSDFLRLRFVERRNFIDVAKALGVETVTLRKYLRLRGIDYGQMLADGKTLVLGAGKRQDFLLVRRRCRAGHDLSPPNGVPMYRSGAFDYMRCRTCHNDKSQEYKARRWVASSLKGINA